MIKEPDLDLKSVFFQGEQSNTDRKGEQIIQNNE